MGQRFKAGEKAVVDGGESYPSGIGTVVTDDGPRRLRYRVRMDQGHKVFWCDEHQLAPVPEPSLSPSTAPQASAGGPEEGADAEDALQQVRLAIGACAASLEALRKAEAALGRK